ncbi:MAG: hypothetical protein SFU98_01475 [Leptospiraceae bacterium]|nr:hypothetical protein [Leptospiraceae bacterium]
MRDKFIYLLALLLAVSVGYFVVEPYWKLYEGCSNKDFLSWDGNLRFIQSIRFSSELKNFEIIDAIFRVLDTPTWPPMRMLLSSPIVLIFGADPTKDIFLTLVTFLILVFTFILILIDFGTPVILWIIGGFIFPVFLFLNQNFITYTFSPMLELQGGLFFILSIYYFYKWNREQSKRNSILLGIFSFLLYFTKYPYGYIFVFISFLFLLVLETESVIFFGIRYIVLSVKKFRPILFMILVLVSLKFIPIDAKIATHIKFFTFLIGFLDITHFIYSRKEEHRKMGYQKIISLFQMILLPILVWTFSHPDRFRSSNGTLNHIQSEGKMVGMVVEKNLSYYSDFFQALFFEGWEKNFGILLLVVTTISFIYSIIQYRKNKNLSFSFLAGFFLFASLIIMTIITENHQSRHVYHLIPTLALIIFMGKGWKYNSWFLAIFSLVVIWISLTKEINKSNVCFSSNAPVYEIPRFFLKESREKLNKPAYLLNRIEEFHYNHADLELVAARVSYEKDISLSIFKTELKAKQDKIEQILSIGRSCDNRVMVPVILSAKRDWKEVYRKEQEDKSACLQIYE